jgi:hypothetical protein
MGAEVTALGNPLFRNLMAAELIKKLLTFYGTRRLINPLKPSGNHTYYLL